MQFSTTDQTAPEIFRHGSSESTYDQLMQNAQFRKWAKIGIPVLIVAAFALGCILPLWYSGNGWISNRSLHPTDFTNPGFQFGSPTVYAKKGETITVKVNIHEVSKGGLYVQIYRRGWDVESYNEFARVKSHKKAARMTVSQPTEKTLTRVADVSDWYYIEFFGDVSSSYTDARFSAEWDVN